MNTPIGSNGLRHEHRSPDPIVAVLGGPGYEARVREIIALRESAKTALEHLKIGEDVKAAHARANQREGEALLMNEAAGQKLADAETQANALFEKAQAKVVQAEQAAAK